jgi:NAD(P)-dependent dehydrogenase (short-subunit alcohol dehydrogenase family)
MSSLRFDGKVVLVTGSGTGIGQAIARRFAEHGASVILMGRRKEPLESTAKELNSIISKVNSNAKVRFFAGVDVSSRDEVINMFNTIGKEFGKVDILVNNAGVSGPVKILAAQPFNEFKECVSIHLTGTFWMTVNALKYMNDNCKVITIATYFTEERPYEQRPYRFRTPYTSAQGAKNRLSEAFAWELAEKGKKIYFIVSNPGPVHSDRIYKTVYPKAAAEFIRIGGFPDLRAKDIERITDRVLPYVGESDDMLNKAINELAAEIADERGGEGISIEGVENAIRACLNKIREVAEKIQNNTKNMVVDGNFLTQDECADIVLNLASDDISRLVNGRIMPSDRVFYPVKPLITTYTDYDNSNGIDLKGKSILFTLGYSVDNARIRALLKAFSLAGAKCSLLLSKSKDVSIELDGIIIDASSVYSIEMDEKNVREHIRKVRPDVVIHMTGNYDYSKELTSLSRDEWDALVDRFINIPALICKESINAAVPDGNDDPSKYRYGSCIMIIIGPDAPIGKKVSNVVRARSEVFRGALRPFAVTATQELSEVLNSNMRVYLVLPGSIDGKEPDNNRLVSTCLYLASGRALKRAEVIYYPDEAR